MSNKHAVKTLTFDWNCFCAVDDERKKAGSRPEAESVEILVGLHRIGAVDVGILATSASESLAGGIFPANIQKFHERINEIGWGGLPIVKTMATYDLTFWDHAFLAPDDAEELPRRIWDVLPEKSIPYDVEEFKTLKGLADDLELSSREYRIWRNKWCDVHSAYAHIHSNRDVFVTSDTHFLNKKVELAELGMRVILTPQAAVSKLGNEG